MSDTSIEPGKIDPGETEPSDADEALSQSGQSVIEFLERRDGEAPRVTLREEDSAAASSPLIDPRSREKSSVPRGRGNYQLMGEIARGGMGVILKGHDTDLGRDVAVKVLHKRLAENPDVVQRFVEEAQIGGQLQHPGIVPVYELGLMADERPFFTMKLVKGRTLAMLLTERESPASGRGKLLDIFESICQTMAYAHSRGVIHRDLKPANIMVGAFGEVQVVDWGLAKVLARGGTADEKRAREAHSNMTILETVRSEGSGSGSDSMVGSILGTPAYMPPEQASGLVDRLDERTDVFALGAILCEILTGLPPYVGDRNEIIAAAAQADYEGAMSSLDESGADSELIKLTKQCLLAAPAARPANASILADRIHQHSVTVEERAHAAQVEAAEAKVRVREEQKARRLTIALGGSVAAILLVLLGGWSYLQQQRAEQERTDAARFAADTLRKSELTADVNATLSEATLLEASESWDEAILVAERAQALAEGGDADTTLRARVDDVLMSLSRGRDRMLSREQQARETEQLLAELNERREPDWSAIDGDETKMALEEANRTKATFLAHGIDLESGTVEHAAKLLTSLGLGAEIALILDGWMQQMQNTQEEELAERILRIAHIVDPDPLRADLREAFARREIDVLKWIASSGFETQPPGTIELLGTSLKRLNEDELARTVFRAGADLYPQSFSLQYRLGRMLVPFGDQAGEPRDLAEGAACLHAALALRPESDIVRFYLGRLLLKLGQHEQALKQFKILYQRTPDDVRVKFHVAIEYENVGDADAALPLFQELVNVISPGWIRPFSLAGIGECHRMRGELESAANFFEQAIRDTGYQNFEWRRSLVDIYLKQSGELASVIRRIEREFPYDVVMYNSLAWSLVMEWPSAENFPIAVRLAERAVELKSSATYLNTLGVALHYAGKSEEAISALSESTRLSGWNVSDSLVLSMAQLNIGQRAIAEEEFQRALDYLFENPTLDPYTLRFREDARRAFGR